MVALLDEGGGALVVLAASGDVIGSSPPPTRIPLDAALPVAESARSGAASWWESGEAVLASYPGLAETALRQRGALAVLPLKVDGRTIGIFTLRFTSARAFSDE